MDQTDDLARRRQERARRTKAAARRRAQQIRKLQIAALAAGVLLMLCILLFVKLGTQETGTPPGTDAAVQSEPTEQGPIRETARATVTVTGDIMTHIPVINAGFDGADYDYNSFFAYIRDYVSRADFAVANLETTFAGTENGNEYSGFPLFNCPDAMADALKNAGFDLLLTANNHSYDTVAYGMERTQKVLAERGLLNLGTTLTADAPKFLIQDVNGIRVGMVCYTYGEIDSSTGQKSVNGLPIRADMGDCINIFDYAALDRFYQEMEGHIRAMKAEGADAVVLFIHWGTEYQTEPNIHQAAIAQKMCDLGVDVIAGGHPHVIQPVTLLTSASDPDHRTLCVYSLGNAVSNQRSSNMDLKTGHTEDGMLFSFTLVKYSDGEVYLEEAEILPTWVYVRYSDNACSYDILPLDPDIQDWKAAFAIGDGNYKNAVASRERTTAIVSDGMAAVDAYLTESKAARDALGE